MTSGPETRASATPNSIMARFGNMIMRVPCLTLAAAFFCLSPMFPGEAVAQKTQSMSVTVNSFTTLDKVSTTTPSFEATESDFLESVGTPSSVSSKSWGTVEITSESSDNHLKLRGQSNQGNFSVSAKVSSADSGFKGITLALDLPGNNVSTDGSEVTFDQTGSATDVIGKGGNGAVVFGVNYKKIKFNGNTVGNSDFNVTVEYTISNTQLGS